MERWKGCRSGELRVHLASAAVDSSQSYTYCRLPVRWGDGETDRWEHAGMRRSHRVGWESFGGSHEMCNFLHVATA